MTTDIDQLVARPSDYELNRMFENVTDQDADMLRLLLNQRDTLREEVERLRSQVDAYASVGPTAEEARALYLEEHNENVALRAQLERQEAALRQVVAHLTPDPAAHQSLARSAALAALSTPPNQEDR